LSGYLLINHPLPPVAGDPSSSEEGKIRNKLNYSILPEKSKKLLKKL